MGGTRQPQLEQLQEDTVNSLYTIAADFEIAVRDVLIPESGALPPTPMTSFVKGVTELSNSSSFLGLLFTGYGTSSFIDPSYHTRLDELDEGTMRENVYKASRLI